MRFSADSRLLTALSHIPKKDKYKTRKMFYSWLRMDDGQFSAAEVKRNERYIEVCSKISKNKFIVVLKFSLGRF
jgi:hypothetical protein